MNNKKICTLIIILMLSPFSYLSAQQQDTWENSSEYQHKAEKKYIRNNDFLTKHFSRDLVIEKEEQLQSNLVIKNGDLFIYGKVEGDILVLSGNVFIKTGAFVDGNISAVEGKISQEEKSTVTGNQIETVRKYSIENVSYHYPNEYTYPNYYPDEHVSYVNVGPLEDEFVFRYNRVQGVFLGMNIPKRLGTRNLPIDLYGYAGYGFAEKKVRYLAGISRSFFNFRDYRFELGAEAYDLTDTRDDWFITPLENTLAAMLIHEDYQDFYRRKGFEVHASQNWTLHLKGTVAFRNDTYESLENNTDWALFGGDKKFRLNPEIEEGNMRSIYGELYLDTRNDRKLPFRGWYAKLSMETSNNSLGSNFFFNQYIFELRHYLPLSRIERLDIRLRAGSAEHELPLQKLFQMGGIGTLEGFRYKEFNGDRLLLGNFEYVISPSLFDRDFLFLDDFSFIIFSDVGSAWYTRDQEDLVAGFEQLHWNDLKSSVGIGISDWKGQVRLTLAKRTDTSRNAFDLSFRIAKPF